MKMVSKMFGNSLFRSFRDRISGGISARAVVQTVALCLLVGTTGCLATDDSDPEEVGEAGQAFTSVEALVESGEAPVTPWWELVGTSELDDLVDTRLDTPASLTGQNSVDDRGHKLNGGGTSDPDPTPWQAEPDPTPWQRND